MPVTVVFSQCIVVGGCRFPSSCKLSIIILDYFAFRNSAPSSASDADATTHLSIWGAYTVVSILVKIYCCSDSCISS